MFTDEDAHRYWFHYTTAFAFLGFILPTMRLRLSPLSKTNDPRESKEWVCSLSLDDRSDHREDFMDINRRFSAVMKDATKVLCLTRDDPDFNPLAVSHLYGRGYSHSSMWDRYAGAHTGVCLALDIETFPDAIVDDLGSQGELIGRWVTYEDMPLREPDAFHLRANDINRLGLEEALKRHRSQHSSMLYFWKSSDWQREFEWRWVLLSDSVNEYEYVDIRASLRGVIFGAEFPIESIPMVRSLMSKDVIFTRMSWLNGHPIPHPATVE